MTQNVPGGSDRAERAHAAGKSSSGSSGGIYSKEEMRDPKLRKKKDAERSASAKTSSKGTYTETGRPDAPGEARQKMLAAGTHTRSPGGALVPKKIVGYRTDSVTGTKKFIAEEKKSFQATPKHPSPMHYAEKSHMQRETLLVQESVRKKQAAGAPDAPGEARTKMLKAGVSPLEISLGDMTPQQQTKFGIGMFTGAGAVMGKIDLQKDMPIEYKPSPHISRLSVSKTTPEALRKGHPTPIKDISNLVGSMDVAVSGKLKTLKYPNINPAKDLVGVADKLDAKLSKYQIDTGVKMRAPPEKRLDIEVFAESAKDTVMEKPVTTAATTAVFAVASPAFAYTKLGISSLPMVGRYASPTTNIMMGAISAHYAGSVTSRVMSQDTGKEKSRVAGEIFAGELAPMAVGGYAGIKYLKKPLYDRPVGYMRTRGMTEIPAENLMYPDVISGKEAFPLIKGKISGKRALETFKSEQYTYKLPSDPSHPTISSQPEMRVWHVTSKAFPKETTVSPGERATTGLFTAPSASMYFSRVGSYPKTKLFSFSSEGVNLPSVMRIHTAGYGRIPKPTRQKGLREMQEYLKSGRASEGTIHITPETEIMRGARGAMEIESVIPSATRLSRINKAYYMKHKGVRIPIEEWRAHSGLKTGVVEPKPTRVKPSTRRDAMKPQGMITSESLSAAAAMRWLSRSQSKYSRSRTGISEYSPPKRSKPAYTTPRTEISRPEISRYRPAESAISEYTPSRIDTSGYVASRREISLRKPSTSTTKYSTLKIMKPPEPPIKKPKQSSEKKTRKSTGLSSAEKYQILNPSADAYKILGGISHRKKKNRFI